MTVWICLFLNAAAAGVRMTVGLFLMFYLLSADRPGRKSIAAVLAGALLPVIGMYFIADLPDVYRMAFETVWISVSASCLQKADVRMSLFVSVFYELAASFWQFLFSAWAGVLFHSQDFLDGRTGSGQTAVWVFHGILAALALFLFHQNMTGKEAFRFASVIVVVGFLAVVTLSEQSVLMIADDTLDMWTLLSIVLMMAVLVFNMNRQYEVEKELAKLKSQQAELLERDYMALNRAYAVNAKLFHDFHNHIGVLQQFLTHKKYEEAVQYLDELQAPVRDMADAVWTGDETADYLINSKAGKAKSCGIRFEAQAEFPAHANIRSADLCAILGNLLDNALEAAGQVPETEERFVTLAIRRINQMVVIKVENSFTALPVEEDGVLKTTKEKGGLHGWGLKSARAAAEKYDGMVQTSYSDSVFRAVATLSY